MKTAIQIFLNSY